MLVTPPFFVTSQFAGRRTEIPLSAMTTVRSRKRFWSSETAAVLLGPESSSPPPAISRISPPINAIATRMAPTATLRRPQSSPGRTSVARRDDEAGRRLAPGSAASLRRREGGRLVASPPARPPLDRLAMTASCRRGQAEPAENQRASDQTQSQQIGAGEGQLAVPGCGRAGSRAVAGTATIAAACITALIAALATGTSGAATGHGGRGGRRRRHSVAFRPGRRRLEHRGVIGDQREQRQRLAHA